jgi:hypothetical protein
LPDSVRSHIPAAATSNYRRVIILVLRCLVKILVHLH